jgi:hypothetical protein
MLVKSGTFAIEQLSEALSSSSDSGKLPDGVSDDALRLCSEQVRLCASDLFTFSITISILDTKGGVRKKKKKNWFLLIQSCYPLCFLFLFSVYKEQGKVGNCQKYSNLVFSFIKVYFNLRLINTSVCNLLGFYIVTT